MDTRWTPTLNLFPPSRRKSDLFHALQSEIRGHTFDTFLTEEPSIANGGPGVVVPGLPGSSLASDAVRCKINTVAAL
jgi:hypothetical protein